MRVQTVSWDRLPATDLFRDYLYRFERLRDWFPGPPFDAEAHRRQMEVRQEFFQRLPHRSDWPAWVQPWDPSAGLAVEATAGLVVTGQQPGLLGGPLFTLYKIVTAVRLAEYWRARGESVGAVFWVLDEDHDLKELLTVASLDAEARPVRPASFGSTTGGSPRSSVSMRATSGRACTRRPSGRLSGRPTATGTRRWTWPSASGWSFVRWS